MTTFQGTETYLIECSRENSAINIEDDDDTNGSWSNETDFVLKRGDRLSVEMVCANIRGSGTSAPTIEFSGQNVVVNGQTKEYCDTKVLLEVFFYMNNNNTYSVGLPLIHPFGGINGDGGTLANFDNLVMPTNLSPRVPKGNVTNQVCNYREVNMGEGYVYPDSADLLNWGIWDGLPPEPAYMNQPGNEIPPLPYFTSQTPGTSPQTPFDKAYQIYQFEIQNAAGVKAFKLPYAQVTTADLGAGFRISAVRLIPHAAVISVPAQTTPPFIPFNNNMLFTDYENGILGGRTGDNYQNNFYPGNHMFINNNFVPGDGTPQLFDWVGQVERIFGVGGLGAPTFNMKVVQLDFTDSNTEGSTQEFGIYQGAASKFDFDCGDCASYVGGIYKLNDGGYIMPKFDIKSGSSQEGLINYDNLELSHIPRVSGKYTGQGYMRGNNNLFMYSRNTRKPQTNQDSSLALFPNTMFQPDIVTGSPTPGKPFFTADAGEYGNLPAGAQFGYRNANIQQENNNDPYIFMRNDHFGKGRRGMNDEKMPDAEPMSAFIYISLKELLQDVNSVTNVINDRLRETITGIGTTTQQTSKLLVNSLENPEQRKPASNVVPYYNRVGFYDRQVTDGAPTQKSLMADTNNAQYRNIITDIIPIKNGGCVKVNPANFTSGRNYLAQNYGKQYGGTPARGLFGNNATQAQLDNIKETTYLREIETSSGTAVPQGGGVTKELLNEVNFQGWANPIYGNMATADLYKYQLGDRWANLPTWNCNRIVWNGGTHPLNRDVGKCVILNNKLEYNVLNFDFPQGLNNYTGDLVNFPNATPSPLICNTLYENQLIYLNIPWPTADDDEGTWLKFAKAMRNYETYYNPATRAPVTYKQQRADLANWIFDGDVGMTDDRSTSQLRTQLGAPAHAPPGTSPEYPVIAPPSPPPAVPFARFQNNRPFYYDWINKPSTEASLATDPIYGTDLGLPFNSTDYRPAIYGANRTLICPTTSHEIFAGVSATSCVDNEEKYRILKELGRLKMKSRFNPDYYKTALNYKGGDIASQSTLPLDNNEIGFRLANFPPDPVERVDTTFMKSLDIGFYPYEYKRGDGTTITLCAIMVGTDYKAVADKISTINFGSMVWGQSIGISNSFYDNHAICPMNNDQVKRGQALTKTKSTAGSYKIIGEQKTNSVYYGNQYYQAPSSTTPFAATLAYTQTLGIVAGLDATIWDFAFDYAVAPYLNTSGRFRCRLVFDDCLQYPGETAQVTWEQSSLFSADDSLNPGTAANFTKISTDSPEFYDPFNPAGTNFTGLFFNSAFNGDNTSPTPNPPTATNTWVLTSGGGIGNFDPANPNKNSGFGCFQARGLTSNGLGDYGAYFNVYYDSGAPVPQFVQFRTAVLEVFIQPTISPTDGVILPNLGLEYNKVNYVWCGATQPTFQYAQDKGRVEFQQLQDDNILNEKSVPYKKDASGNTSNSSAVTGTKAGILNTATEDAVFSRNSREDDFVNSKKTAPVKNSGIRAEISGVGIYKIWLCEENYEPPNNINLSSYWNNAEDGKGLDGLNEIAYWGQTELNRQKIIAGCVEADENNWGGSLFERLGFQSHRELLPAYGKQQNRFNPSTYNSTRPDKISRGTKPLILCNAVDNSIDPALNTFFTADPSGNSVNGIPMYSNGMLNDESISLQLVNQTLTASAPPILSTSPFLLIESDICSTNYRSGSTQKNVLFYLMKNYQASSFIYGYGSSYTHTANQDRTLSLINTAFRDPITGRLQKCSNNSTIIYKIQRDIVILPPTTDALGNPLPIAKPAETETEKLLNQIVSNTDKQGSKGGGAIGTGVAGGGKSAPPNVPLFQSGLLQMVQENAGANMDIQGGADALQALEVTFQQINANPNITPTEAEVESAVAFTIQQLLGAYPLELIIDSQSNQIGIANPSMRGAGSGEGREFLDDSATSNTNLSQNVTTYLTRQLQSLGGLRAITALMEDGADAETKTDELAQAVSQITINPLTGEQVGEYGETIVADTDLNQFGYLTFNSDGSNSFQQIARVMTQFLENTEQGAPTDNQQEENAFYLQQARLQDTLTTLFTNAIAAGNRISLSDPAGEWVQPQLGAELQGLSQERRNRMRVVENSYDDEERAPETFSYYEQRYGETTREMERDEDATARSMGFRDANAMYEAEQPGMNEANQEGMRIQIGERQATPNNSPRVAQRSREPTEKPPKPPGVGSGTKEEKE